MKHAALTVFLWWYLVGALIPTCMLAFSLWGAAGKTTRARRFALAVVVGPPCWIVLGFACAVGLVMWSIHKIRRGPLMPPGSPSPGGKAA